MDINELREKIDAIDGELVPLFEKRLRIASEIAEYKKENCVPVCDPLRESQKLAEIAEMCGPGLGRYVTELYARIFEISRSYQQSLIEGDPNQ
ncbi:MAG: chorismate mutase [Clostridia bacterium]|nr:chorismate mutase [Clostridia bacterium]